MLEAADIIVRYGAVLALNGVSMRIGRGEIVAIVGSNGVGKTTLLKSLAGVLMPTSGRILLDGADVTQAPVGAFEGERDEQSGEQTDGESRPAEHRGAHQ